MQWVPQLRRCRARSIKSSQGLSREQALGKARALAAERAVKSGADTSTLAVVEQEDIPLAYLPGNSLRVRVRVVGDVVENI